MKAYDPGGERSLEDLAPSQKGAVVELALVWDSQHGGQGLRQVKGRIGLRWVS